MSTQFVNPFKLKVKELLYNELFIEAKFTFSDTRVYIFSLTFILFF